MARSIKQLLKGKELTGEEVGRLMIKDLLAMHDEFRKSKNQTEYKGLFTDAERQKLVDSIPNNRHDITVYQSYRQLHTLIADTMVQVHAFLQEYEANAWRLMFIVSEYYHIVMNQEHKSRLPKIVTKKQYDDLYEAEKAKLDKQIHSMEFIIFDTLNYYLKKYKQGKRTKYNKYFTAAKKQKITNRRILANYWPKDEGGYFLFPDGKRSCDMTLEEHQRELKKYPPYSLFKQSEGEEVSSEVYLHNRYIGHEYADVESPVKWVEDLSAPADATKFEVLEYADGFYMSAETDSKETLKEFKADYPELYNEIVKEITNYKGMESTKDIKETDYTNDDIGIPLKTLVKSKFLDYEKRYDRIHINGYGSGIAVLQDDVVSFGAKTDNKGYYVNEPTLLEKMFSLEEMDDDQIYSIIATKRGIVSLVKRIKQYITFLILIAEMIEVPELKKLAESTVIDINIVVWINDRLEKIVEDAQSYNDDGTVNLEKTDELKQRIKDVFSIIKMSNTEPGEETIKKAKRHMLDVESIIQNEKTVLSILGGGDHEQ
ncbi:hypothetical protein RG959_22985 [Domibacillus sp. 8LH]|uniref:hypothetical protein n=1 Tax=Domibacillus sp. 8LH TaxID=3073900 RepID=UPI00317851B4